MLHNMLLLKSELTQTKTVNATKNNVMVKLAAAVDLEPECQRAGQTYTMGALSKDIGEAASGGQQLIISRKSEGWGPRG
ncbi:hypothetical protein GWI33_017889 [Rhynchophorus ferrugineus]|uniref:Uncharacterized protein n=1 Tax=Rhynchophorus ferrugineus TaxID=354439 RepID=A0A834I184_RHYFE|nr:hypothetical protein GWI33_017889 [Rhynchophorus ferrugineus]